MDSEISSDLSVFEPPQPALNCRLVNLAITDLIGQRNYPCVAATKALHDGEIQIGTYGFLGSGSLWESLRASLIQFSSDQKVSKSIYSTYFAAFEAEDFSESTFEDAFWKELSFLTSYEDKANDWMDSKNSDPSKKSFRFSLDGTEFFVVGLHPRSSRQSRRFPYPAMVFNVFEQFETLEELGQYEPMVKINRARDKKFQGSANPMVEAHGDEWESIQFSGKENGPGWKCPFHFLSRNEKPQNI